MNRRLKQSVIGVFLFLVALPLFAQSTGSEADFLYARRLYEDGLYDLAADALGKYLEAEPESPYAFEANRLIGESRWNEKQYEEARQAFQRAAMTDPENSRAVEALERVADSYEVQQQWRKAARALQRIPVLYPNHSASPAALVRAGRLLIDHGDFADAEVPLQQAMRQYPEALGQREARLLWARVLANRGELEQAAELAGDVADATRDENLAVEALSYQGDWFWRLGRDPEAEAAWRRILTDYPRASRRGDALTRMGQQRLRIGEADQAVRVFEEALRSNLTSEQIEKEAVLGLADANLLIGNDNRALQQLAKLDLSSDPTLRFRKALALEGAGQAREAIALYRELSKSASGELATASLGRIGLLSAQLGREHDATDAFMAAADRVEAPLARSEVRYLALQQMLHTEPLRLLELADRFAENAPKSGRLDDVMLLRADALLLLDRDRVAVRAFRDLAAEYLASPLARDALRRAEYLESYVLPLPDAATRMAGLMAELASGIDRREISLRLAEVYLRQLKDVASAKQQLMGVFADTGASADQLEQARNTITDALWMEYMRAVYGDNGLVSIPPDRRRTDAAKAVEALAPVAQALTDPTSRAINDWRLVLLERDSRSVDEGILYLRRAAQDHLAEYPDSPHAGDAYLELGKAFSVRVGDEPVRAGGSDDPAIWYLEMFRDDYRGHPDYAEGLLLLADRYAAAKRFGDAGAAYREIIRLGESPQRVDAALDLLDPNKSKDESGADEVLEWVREKAWYHPKVSDVRELLIRRLIDEGQYVEASTELENLRESQLRWGPELVIEGAGSDSYAYLTGRVLEGLGQIRQAREAYLHYLSLHPRSPQATEIHLRLAEIRLRDGYLDAALRHYRRVLGVSERSPSQAAALRGASQVLFRQQQYEAARRYASQVSGQDVPSDTAFAYDRLAVLCLYRLGRLDDARQAANEFKRTWSRADGLYDASARFELERGRWLSKNGSYDEAEKNYKRILSRYKNSRWVPEAKYEWGRDLLEQNRFEPALDILTKMPREYPGNPVLGKIWWVLGNHYARHGDIMDAVSTYEKVLSDSSYQDIWPYVLVNQIRAYRQAGFYAGALQSALKYLELYPDAQDAFDRRMDVGMMYLQMGQYDLAMREFREIQPIADVENEAAIQFYIGEALEKAGRLSEAVIEYKKVDYLGKRTKMQWAITALYNAGRVLERLGEPERATEMYREIVRREGNASPFGRKAQEQIDRIDQAGG